MTKPLKLRKKAVAAPRHLDAEERQMWRAIVAEYDFSDPASQALLQSGLEAHQRSRRCRELIDKEGASYRDRFGQPKPHPLLGAERDGRTGFLAAMRLLNLDVGND